MWTWANASLYTKQGQAMILSNNINSFGLAANYQDPNPWYVLNADNAREMGKYHATN